MGKLTCNYMCKLMHYVESGYSTSYEYNSSLIFESKKNDDSHNPPEVHYSVVSSHQ